MADNPSIKIGIDFDKASVGKVTPEVRAAAKSLSDMLQGGQGDKAGGIKAPDITPVLETLTGTGDKAKAQKQMARIRLFLRDQMREFVKAQEDTYAAEKGRLEALKEKIKASSPGGIDEKGPWGSYVAADERFKSEMAKLNEWRRGSMASVRKMQTEQASAIGWVKQGVSEAPPPEEDEGGGGGGVKKRGRLGHPLFQFGFGALRGVVGGGLLMGGAGFLGYQLMRRAQQAGDVDAAAYNVARGISGADTLTGGMAAMDQFRNKLYSPFMGAEESTRAAQAFFSRAGRGGMERSGEGIGAPRTIDESHRLETANLGMFRQATSIGVGLGVGGEQGARFFGEMARRGLSINQDTQRQISEKIAEAVASGQMRGREGEVLAGIEHFLELSSKTMITPPSVRDILALQASLVTSNLQNGAAVPGLQGEYGMRILGQAHETMAATGASLYRMPSTLKPMMMIAMANAGITDPWAQMSLGSKGMFAELGTKDNPKTLFEAVREMFPKEMGSGDKLMFAAQFPSIPPQGIEYLSNLKPGQFGKAFEGVPDDVRKAIGEGGAARQAQVIELLERRLSATEKGESAGTTEEFVDALKKIIADTPSQEERLKAQAKISQDLNKAFSDLIPVVQLATGVIAGFTDTMTKTIDFIKEKLGLKSSTPEQVEPSRTPVKPYSPFLREWLKTEDTLKRGLDPGVENLGSPETDVPPWAGGTKHPIEQPKVEPAPPSAWRPHPIQGIGKAWGWLKQHAGAIAAASEYSGIPQDMIAGVIQTESRGRADATNPKSNATGLGQIIPKWWGKGIQATTKDLTGKDISEKDIPALKEALKDPDINAAQTGKILARAMVLAKGDERKAYGYFLLDKGGMAEYEQHRQTPGYKVAPGYTVRDADAYMDATVAAAKKFREDHHGSMSEFRPPIPMKSPTSLADVPMTGVPIRPIPQGQDSSLEWLKQLPQNWPMKSPDADTTSEKPGGPLPQPGAPDSAFHFSFDPIVVDMILRDEKGSEKYRSRLEIPMRDSRHGVAVRGARDFNFRRDTPFGDIVGD
jgi:Transglycosylase SLT domain